ncbi:MAG: HDIG domain-containing protein [Phycisphaerales bacterium]|nr:HDIG domain-containing protein [Phycisphaerales bacterium]
MWPFNRTTARRQEIRRTKAEYGLTVLQRIRERVSPAAIAIAVISASLTALVLNAGQEWLPYQAGESITRAVTARIGFRVEDAQQTELLRRQARETSPNYFNLDSAFLEDIRGRWANALAIAKGQSTDAARVREDASKLMIQLDEEGASELIRIAVQPETTEFDRFMSAILDKLAEQPLVESNEVTQRRRATQAVLLDAGRRTERVVSIGELLSNQPQTGERIAASIAAAAPRALRASVLASMKAMMRVSGEGADLTRPLFRFDSQRTAIEADLAFGRVPTQYLQFAKDAVLADAPRIEPNEIERLRAEHEAFLAHSYIDPEARSRREAATAGRTLLAALVTVGLVGFVYRYRPAMPENSLRPFLTALTLVALLAVTRVAVATGTAPAQLGVGAQALAAALLSIVYARVVIFGLCGGMAVLMTLATGQGVTFLVTLLAVSGCMVFGLRTVRNRGKIVGVGVGAAALVALTTAADGMIDQQTWAFIGRQALWAAGSTLAAAFLVEGLLPWIERSFGVTTAMTLLEWCDADKPLMRLMAAEAPGTYNHSLLVGALAEASAEAIDADGLLARAGSYYHDIGKINKPEYFIENQSHPSNRHERLSPAMSLLIIIGHVKDGVEMAKEYRLPRALRPFIAQHHGTTLVEYFFHAANRARRQDEPEISDTEFRYPGPKPQTREVAIVMLADGVESAVRAMQQPTPARIEQLVSSIAQKRLIDGQFDECDLTFRDLETIERSLVKSLCGIYHARIQYPTKASDGSSTGLSSGSTAGAVGQPAIAEERHAS